MPDADAGTAPVKLPTPICAIGASAGGIAALQTLFRQLPSDLGLAYVVILHLAPDHPSALAQILSNCTAMPVVSVDDSPTLKPDHIFVILPDRELVIEDDSVTSRPFDEPRGRRMPIDAFFVSVAVARGDGMAIVLSGAGADGAQGVRAIKEAGGVVLVQEPAEAGFPSMPQSAIATGVPDFVLPLARMAERVVEVARSKEAVRSLDTDAAAVDLRRIIAFLRSRIGHDFSSYKRATVLRRVKRRMQVCRKDSLGAYLDHLYATPEEPRALFADLLISVTSFFRDPTVFEALERLVVGPLFDDLDPDSDDGLRVWSVGCATGEEAYSVVILLLEEMERRKRIVPIQVFATDLDDDALAKAREGCYPRTIENEVSEQRLARFFVDERTHYRVRQEVRDAVLFASHSVLKDPPFLRLDLVTCRNLLIYLERSMQQQVGAIFHYALRPGRYLFLGSAETMDATSGLFGPLDRDARIYAARPHAAHAIPVMPQYSPPNRHAAPGQPAAAPRGGQAELPAVRHGLALEAAAPPSALVDDGYNILHLSRSAGRFMSLSEGPLSTLLPAMVREELRLDLRVALARAVEQRLPTLTHAVPVMFEGGRRRVAMHVLPVPGEIRMGLEVLVQFLDGGPVAADDATAEEGEEHRDPREVRRLHAELRAAQEALVLSRSSHDVSMQELRAANEELQSMNEEYRSTAEELETSKEELQSINEELHTVNAELKSKLESISVAHGDLQNLTAATEIGTLFLGPDLRIRMFTPPVVELFNVTRLDIGRPVTDFTHHLEYADLLQDLRRLLADLTAVEREVRTTDGHWYVMRLRPYRTVDQGVDGLVLTFIDVTVRREAVEELARLNGTLEHQVAQRTAELTLYRNIVQSTRSPICAYDTGQQVTAFNEAHAERWRRITGREADIGQSLSDAFPPKLAAAQCAIAERALSGEEFTVQEDFGALDPEAPHWELDHAPIRDETGRIIGAFHHARDVTTRLKAERELAEAQATLRQSQKMEAVGQLTGGLAHDFNNLLGGIAGSLELLGAHIAEGRIDSAGRYLDAAQGATWRAAALTHRLLAFSRRQTLDSKPMDVSRLVSGMEELIRRTVGPAIKVVTPREGAGLWPILVDAGQLENALLNLCLNARDAMPDGGEIRIDIRSHTLDDRAALDAELMPGEFVSLDITDTGIGMAPDVIARAFDPFFTTKPIGQGTGLGLSMIYGFARQSGGQARIRSESGRGTTVTIDLPRYLGELAMDEPAPASTELPSAREGQTVLVVDDEPTMRMLVTDALGKWGFRTMEAADAATGLQLLRSNVRIDLLVTDVGLPGGLNGRQMADAARDTRSDLSVLFITGYAEGSMTGDVRPEPSMQVLTKPFGIDALAERVRILTAE